MGFQASDSSWLEELYRSHFHSVLRQCRSALWDRDEAADAAHDVFARALKRGEPFESPDHARAWLMTVARNHCTDILRGRGRLHQALGKVAQDVESIADPERLAIDRQVVSAVLAQLTWRERRLLWQSAVEHQPIADIAAGLRLSYLAAAQALGRARRRAWHIAARIAVIIGLIRVRRLIAPAAAAQPALLLALVPLIAVSVPSSAQAQRQIVPSASAPVQAVSTVAPSALPARASATVASTTSGPTGAGSASALPQLPSAESLPVITGAVGSINAVIAEHELDNSKLGQIPATPVKVPPLPSASAAVPRAPLVPAH